MFERMKHDEVATSVLIIGDGCAGRRTAIALARQDVDCLVVSKQSQEDTGGMHASDGINAALGNADPEDRWDIHAADTVREGRFLNQPEAVELLCKTAPDRVEELQDWGCDFTTTDDGAIAQRYVDAQSYRRTCFVGDRTADAVATTLGEQAEEHGVSFREDVFVTKLLGDRGKIAGALGYDMSDGHFIVFKAKAVVLADGGYAQLYKRNSATGYDAIGLGPALALDAGAPLQDLELVQFHPTGLVAPDELHGALVPDAVRGEGGTLFNSDGDRFMAEYSPEKLELDTRDVVARAIYQELQDGNGTGDGGVLLDITDRAADVLQERLPRLYDTLQEHGIDIAEDAIAVAPTAHYTMGGVRVDPETGQAGVEGLFAVGEAASGVHGANRLGGNGLADAVVFGKIYGTHIAEYATDAAQEPVPADQIEDHVQTLDTYLATDDGHDPQHVLQQLQELMWRHAGIVRDAGVLKDGLTNLKTVQEQAEQLQVDGGRTSDDFAAAMAVRSLLPLAEAVIRGALEREESRAAHYRDDFPDEDDAWRQNIVYRTDDDGELVLDTAAVPEIPAAIQQALDEDHSMVYDDLD